MQWRETSQVLDGLAALWARGERAALATVVRVRGSAYRRPGAKLLVAADGTTLGNVSGGCLEQDVREVALRVIATGRAERRAYCSGADPVDAWDLGVGCEGEVEVYVEPLRTDRHHLRTSLDGEEPFAFCTPCEDGNDGSAEGLLVSDSGVTGTLGDSALDAFAAGAVRLLAAEEASGLHEVAGRTLFIDRFQPPPRLLVFGAGEDARPVARLALEAGFRVTVVDRRAGLLDPVRFAPGVRLIESTAALLDRHVAGGGECFALLMTHNFADDRAYAAALAGRPLRYLGILGPRARTERLLQTPETADLADDPRLYGPLGLDLGSEGAEQVAISILAELLAVRSGRSGRSLRERCAPIHAREG